MPASVRSLLLTKDYPPGIGGMEEYFRHLARGLPEGSIFVSAPRRPGWRRADAASPIPVSRPPFGHASTHKFAWVLVWWAWALAIVARRRIRFLHCGNLTPGGYLGWWTKRLLGIPYAVYFFGMDVERALRKKEKGGLRGRSLGRILDGADVLFVISADTRERLRRLGADDAKIVLLRPGVDVARFTPGAPADGTVRALPGRLRLLTVGRHVKRKGVDRLVRALPRIRERVPEVALIVVGRGQRENLAPLAAELGLADAVHFAGEVPAEILPDYYRAADVFVMPSGEEEATGSVEGFGIVFLEAAACGKPAVGGRSGGVGDAVVDGETGFLVDPADEDDLVAKTVRLLEDADLRRKMGERARARVEAELSWREMGRIADAEVRRIVGAGGP